MLIRWYPVGLRPVSMCNVSPAVDKAGAVSSLLIVTGPPGAGKSAISAALAKHASPSVLVEGDQFFGFPAEGAIEPWLPESGVQNEIVTEAAAAATGRFARDYETVYDGVVGPWFLPTFALAAGLVELDYVIVLPPAEVCVSRVAARTGHGFSDEEATRKMHAEFDRASIEARHVLAGGSASLEEPVAAIRREREAGRFRYRVD
ncbi:MAG: ATP-binding protein [Actinomycetia bacterium]|nr:ATP-binding protein [Actinomycetes bacterium]